MSKAVANAHASEVRAGNRFEFGSNWRRFLRVLSDERIFEAEKSLKDFLQADNLQGRTFLDIGSGSGLFSLAARRLGARVVSFDYDPQSVACTAELRRRYSNEDANWRVLNGSVLDQDFLKSLGTFDVVYSWGVLHHTGDMWQGLENVKLNTRVGGKLFIAIYNDCGDVSHFWKRMKIRYNKLPSFLKLPFAVAVWTPIDARYLYHYWKNGNTTGYFKLWSEYKKSRGMSRWHDMIDWLGGYPYEYASVPQLTSFYENAGYKLLKLVPDNGYGCNQHVFERLS